MKKCEICNTEFEYAEETIRLSIADRKRIIICRSCASDLVKSIIEEMV